MRRLGPGLVALALASVLSAQTLQQAQALWKARRYQDANNEFRALVAKYPDNPEYRVQWGRMYFEHWQPDVASDLFNEALKLKPNDADALLGLALVAADDFEGRAEQLAKKALEANPKLLEAQELLARLALEDNNNAKAIAEAQKAIAMDPQSVQGRAILATIDWLADKKETKWDPHTAKGYETAGHFFVLNRRYEEGIDYLRKAIALDPKLYTARSELGVNLMRLGYDDEAYQQLKTCYDNDFQDYATVNSLKLLDSFNKNFVTFKTPTTILKLDKREAGPLRLYIEPEMQKIIATYEQKYRMKLDRPVQVEVYPNHEDFAVRTLGVPGLGALGVTFGYVVAMDSPSGRTPGEFHWAETLWHEMSHVFTLTATGHRVPRWFTEGMAVQEETAINPQWGDRISPEILKAIKEKKLLPVAELDRGFIHPTEPAQVLVSYFQGGRVINYIKAKWGWDTLLAMLHDFGNSDVDTAAVIRKELKIEPEEFDKQFVASVEAETKSMVDNFDRWRAGIKTVSDMAKAKNWDGVIKEGTAIRDLYPDYIEAGSVYEFLANAYIEKNDKPAAIAQLEAYVKNGGRYPETFKKLAKLLIEAGKKKEAADDLAQLNYIYPLDNEAHQMLGTLLLEQNDPKDAVREFQAIVLHNPIDPAQSHYDLARAYNLNHQTDQAKDELFSALEAAPDFRPAQKLLLDITPGTK